MTSSRNVGDGSGAEKRWERLPSRDEGAQKYDEMGKKSSKKGFEKSGWIKSATSQQTEKAGKFGSREQIRVQKSDENNITIQVIRQGAFARAFSSLGLSLGKRVITQVHLKAEYPLIDFDGGKINLFAVQSQLRKHSTSREKADLLIKKLEVYDRDRTPLYNELMVDLKKFKATLAKEDLSEHKITILSEALKGCEKKVEAFIENKKLLPNAREKTDRLIKKLERYKTDGPRIYNDLMVKLRQLEAKLSKKDLTSESILSLNETLKNREKEVEAFIENIKLLSNAREKTDRLIKKLEPYVNDSRKILYNELMVELRQLEAKLSKEDQSPERIHSLNESIDRCEKKIDSFIENKNPILVLKEKTERLMKRFEQECANDPRETIYDDLMIELEGLQVQFSKNNLPPNKILSLSKSLQECEADVERFIADEDWIPERYIIQAEMSDRGPIVESRKIGSHESVIEFGSPISYRDSSRLRRGSDPGPKRLKGLGHWSSISAPKSEKNSKVELSERLAAVMKSSDFLISEENKNEIVTKLKILREQPNISYEKFKSGIESLELELEEMLAAEAENISQIEGITEEELVMGDYRKRLDEVDTACALLDVNEESEKLSAEIAVLQSRLKDPTLEIEFDSFAEKVEALEKKLSHLVDKQMAMDNLVLHLSDLRKELEHFPTTSDQYEKIQKHIKGIEGEKDLSPEDVQIIIKESKKFLKALPPLESPPPETESLGFVKGKVEGSKKKSDIRLGEK